MTSASSATVNFQEIQRAGGATVGRAFKPSTVIVPPPQAKAAGYTSLVFDDEFNTLNIAPAGNSTGTYNWYPGLWFNSVSTPSGLISAASGVLDLDWNKNTAESTGPANTTIQSESASGTSGHTFRYGYFEARMKWDNVTGAWPAFWLIPVQAIPVNGVKATQTGEIDIFEGQGGLNYYYGTLHSWTGNTDTWYSSPNDFALASNDFTQYHLYGVLWTPGSGSQPGTVTWYYDNKEVGLATTTSSNNSVFDQQDFFLVLTSQAGVNWSSSLIGVTASNINLDVDWVHVWH